MNSDIENAVTQRVIEFIRSQHMSETQFATYIGIGQSTLNKQIRMRGIKVGTLLMMLERFPDLSAEWLMRGKETTIAKTPLEGNGAYVGAINSLMTDIEYLKEQNKTLLNIVAKLIDSDSRGQ